MSLFLNWLNYRLFQQKRVHDHSIRLSQLSSSETTLDKSAVPASPVFYTHLPSPLPQAIGLVGTGEQSSSVIHHPTRNYNYGNSIAGLPQQQVFVATGAAAIPARQDRSDRNLRGVPSQEVVIGSQNVKCLRVLFSFLA